MTKAITELYKNENNSIKNYRRRYQKANKNTKKV